MPSALTDVPADGRQPFRRKIQRGWAHSMRAIDWVSGPRVGHIRLIDQTRLPGSLVELEIHTVDQLVDAIRRLAVRGAPALGVAGAMGVALAASQARDDGERARLVHAVETARPTAVN